MFIVLGVAWVCALGPGVVRSLAQRGVSFGIGRRNDRRSRDFRRGGLGIGLLGAIGAVRALRGRRRPVARPATVRLSPAARRTRKRRRELLAGLFGVAFGSLLLGLVPGLRMLLVLSGVSTALFSVYVVALLRLKASQSSPIAAPVRTPAYQYAYNRASGE
jgi:hypothetical protein